MHTPDARSSLDRFIAAACGDEADPEAAESMLASDPGLGGRTIHGAAAAGNAEAVVSILEQETSPGPVATTPGGPLEWPPLLYACFSRLGRRDSVRSPQFAAVAKALLRHGADADASLTCRPAAGGRLPALYGAAGVNGNLPLTAVLLDAGANPNDGESMFHAAEHGFLDCLELLMARGGDLNDTSHPAGNTPLHWMLDWCFVPESVKWVLEHGADPNVRVGPAGETALHVAVRRRRVTIVDPLLAHGAAIDARTAGGKTAFAHARRRGFTEVTDLLARRGADTTLTVADELAAALVAPDLAEARSIIEAHPDLVCHWGPEDARILPDLAGRPMPEAVALLLDAGADIAAPGLDGGTALHQAAWFGQPEVAALLIERGAPLEVCDSEHDSTPLGWTTHGSRYSDGAAERAVYARIAEMLLEAGASLADPAAPDADPHGRWLLRNARDEVAVVLRRYGARD